MGTKSAHLKQLWINTLKLRGDFMTIFGYLGSCPCALHWKLKMCTYLEIQLYPLTCLYGKLNLLFLFWGRTFSRICLRNRLAQVALMSVNKVTLKQKHIQFDQHQEMLFVVPSAGEQRGWSTAFWNLTRFLVEEHLYRIHVSDDRNCCPS